MTPGQKIKLGVFLLASAGVTLLVLTMFGGLSLFDRDLRYFVNVPGGVNGLEKGSIVQLRGVRVGSVADFELYPEGFDGVRVTLKVAQETRIHEGARASIGLQGLTGLKQLDIDPGQLQMSPLPPGATIPYQPSGIQRITGEADELADRVTRLLEELTALGARLTAIAESIDPARITRVLEHADRGTEQVLRDTRRTARELNALLGAARVVLEQTGAQTEMVLGTTQRTANEAAAAFAAIELISRRLDGLVRTTDDQLRGVAFDLHDASRSLKQLGQEIRLQPSRLLFSSPPPERKLP